jgi:hypothetical protein
MVIQRCFGDIGSQVRILLPRQKEARFGKLVKPPFFQDGDYGFDSSG